MKTSAEVRDELIHLLYGATLSPTGWSEVMAAWTCNLQTVNAHLMVWDQASSRLLHTAHAGIDQQVQDKYEAYYASIDPRLRHCASLGEGEWVNCAQLFGEHWVSRNEFYQDFLIPSECRWLLGTRLVHRQGLDVYFGVHRAPGQQPFSAGDMALVRELTPHFQQAAHLWLATQSLRRQAALGVQGLDVLEHGVIVTNRHGHLVHANRHADAMLRAAWPLRLCGSHLRLAADLPHAEPSRLGAALQACARTWRPQWLPLGEWGDPAQPLCTLTLLSLAQDSVLRTLPLAGEVLLLLSHSQHRRQVTVEQLMALFDLTPAEARLARALGGGDALDTYGQGAGIAISTVRTQLQAVFRKTGVRSQPDLVRLLVMLPSGRAGSSRGN